MTILRCAVFMLSIAIAGDSVGPTFPFEVGLSSLDKAAPAGRIRISLSVQTPGRGHQPGLLAHEGEMPPHRID